MELLLLLLLQDVDGFGRADRDAACLDCHQESGEELRGSVHEATGCVGCHGVDEVRRGQVRGNPHRRIAEFRSWKGRNLTDDCGSCHAGPLEALKGSEHYVDTRSPAESMKRGCIECHGYHGVRDSARSSIAKECRRCHEPGSRDLDWGEAAFGRMDDLERTLLRCEEKLAELRGRPGIATADVRAAAGAARRSLAEMATAQHGLDFIRLEAAARQGNETLAAAYNPLAAREREFARRWLLLAPFLLFAGAAAALVGARAARDRKDSGA